MVRHGVAKKRRSGSTSTKLKTKPHRALRVQRAIKNSGVKELYNKNLSPADNLKEFGLVADVNKMKKELPGGGNAKCAAFVGFAEMPVPKVKKGLGEDDQNYARACIGKYGDNYSKMARDIVTNFNQLTEHKLEKLCKRYQVEMDSES